MALSADRPRSAATVSAFFINAFRTSASSSLSTASARPATFILPVLEDANSIQIALMQVMRLLVSQQIEHKTASLLLYALQTASTNLRMTEFKPIPNEVILEPRNAGNTLLGESVWEDEDFEDEDEEDEEEPAPKLDPAEALYAKMRAERVENGRKRGGAKKWKMSAAHHPEAQLVRDEYDCLKVQYKDRPATQAQPPAPPQPAEKKPAATFKPAEIGAQLTDMVRKSGLVEKYGSLVQPKPQPN